MEDRSLMEMEGFTLALNYTSTLQPLSNRKQRFADHIQASLSDRSLVELEKLLSPVFSKGSDVE